MKKILIYTYILISSCLGTSLLAQEKDSIQITTTKDSITKPKRGRDVFIGIDAFTPALSLFTDKKGAQAMFSIRLTDKWHFVTEVGYDKNKYKKLGWKVEVDGTYIKVGANRFISMDIENKSNGFYLGGRLAYASYTQNIKQYPIRNSDNEVSEYGSFPKKSLTAYWAEFVIGGRVKLYSNFYADFSLHPEFYLGGGKQEGVKPLVTPGYGKDIGAMNFSVFWGLTYRLF